MVHGRRQLDVADARRRPAALPTALVVGLSLLLALAAVPQAGHAAPTGETSTTTASAAARSQVDRDGLVRVLVELDEHVRPEGRLGVARARQQRERIRDAQRRVADVLPADHSQVGRAYRTVPAMAMTVTEEGLRALEASTDVRAIEVDRRVEHALSDDEPLEPMLAESAPHVGARELHDLDHRGAGQAVAVLDTGVEADHPAFGGRVVAEACFSTDDGDDGFCPDGTSEQIGSGAAAPLAGSGHGTHVAGIAAGAAVEDLELADGVAPAADVLAVQVFSEDGGGGISSSHSDLLAGLEWVAAQDAHDIAAVNLSLGGGSYQSECSDAPFETVVDDLASQGIAVVAASGNGGEHDAMTWPACLPGVISVGSTDIDDTDPELSHISDFTNATDFLDLLAPGSDVRSAIPGGADAGSGTSMATPHVAGGLALLHEATEQPLTPDDALQALRDTGVLVADDRDGAEDPLEFPEIRLDAAHAQLTTGSVTGTARDLDTGEGIADATLDLVTQETDTPEEYAATTDADGTFEISGVVPDTYDLTADADGYTPATETVVAEAASTATADLDLAADADDPDDTDPEEPEPAPGQPVDLTAEATVDEVALSWSAGDGGEVDGFELDRDGAQLWTGTDASYLDAEVESGAAHVYEVRATGPGGTSEPATLEVEVPEPETEPEPELEPEPEPEPSPPVVTFPDVDPDGPHGAAIGRMAGAGIINGYDDGAFRPSRTLTRAQAASLLVRGLEIGVTEPTGRFGDVPVDYAHAATVEAAARAGITSGYDDGTFRPGEPLTRAQAASMIARAFELPAGGAHGFTDVTAGHPHGANIAAAAAAGAVGGYPDGTFRPVQHLTRAQTASILDRLLHD